MGSNWNRWMATVCSSDLTRDEHLLAAALARELLGFRVKSGRLSEKRLRTRAHLHGRSLGRARAGLVEKGLLRFAAGSAGRAGAGSYELVFTVEDTSGVMPAPPRVFRRQERPLERG